MPSSPAFTVWHFATNWAAVKFAKLSLSNRFSESRDPSDVGSATCAKCPVKDWQGKSCWLHPRETTKRSSKDQMERMYLRPCSVSSWCWASRNIWDCCWPWGISSPPRAACPRTLPWKNVGVLAWWFATYNVEFVIAIGEWTWSNGESPLLLRWGSSVRLSQWFVQGDTALWLQ